MKFKKILALLLVFVLCLTVTACTDKNVINSEVTTTAATTVASTLSTEQTPEDITTQPTTQITTSQSTTVSTTTKATTPKTTAKQTTTSPTTKKQSTVPGSTPLLYKVTDSKGNVAWLFGSIHVGRKSMYPLPDYVMNAFKQSDSLAVEFDIIAYEKDLDAQIESVSKYLYTDRTTIRSHVTEETLNAAIEILKANGLYDQVWNYYCATVWADLINGITYERYSVFYEYGIDRYLINEAYKQNKEVLDVESASFQSAMMAGFSDRLQEMLLKSAIEDYYEISVNILEEHNTQIDIWSKGNESIFAGYLNLGYEFESPQEELLYQEYNKAMITDRNKNMADYAEEALKSGKEVFICVGAAHVVGKGAMADLLKQRGYKVELVK
ncbi:MAG: TraB/GumN family protein [Clostridia bacterium]|nr:TraB/GumN family protein [Clostridia bacterium]